MNTAVYSFLAELGQKISAVSGDDRESSYLFQRISVLIRYVVARELYGSVSVYNYSVNIFHY